MRGTYGHVCDNCGHEGHHHGLRGDAPIEGPYCCRDCDCEQGQDGFSPLNERDYRARFPEHFAGR